MITKTCLAFSDEGPMERGRAFSQDPLLGPGSRGLEAAAYHPPTQVDVAGNWHPGDERKRPGNPDSQHAHHDLQLLPEQVCVLL